MKLTNQQILNFLNSNIMDKKLPIKFAYAISVNIEAIKPAFDAYNKQRVEIIEKYVKRNEDGEPVVEDANFVFEDTIGFNKALTELLEAEAEVNITLIKADVLEKCDESEYDCLTIPELMAINFMIEK